MPNPPSKVTPPAVPPPAPPAPRGASDLSLTVLRREINRSMVVNQSIHSLAKSIFKPGVEIKYMLGVRNYYGTVVEVIGEPGRTQVRVINIATSKKRDLWLTDIVGILQEA